MGAGIGFSRSAQLSHKQNKELLADRKTYGGGRQAFPKNAHVLEFKETDVASLEILRLKLLKERRRATVRIMTILTVIIAITLFIVFFLAG
jgi:hypothetical protein